MSRWLPGSSTSRIEWSPRLKVVHEHMHPRHDHIARSSVADHRNVPADADPLTLDRLLAALMQASGIGEAIDPVFLPHRCHSDGRHSAGCLIWLPVTIARVRFRFAALVAARSRTLCRDRRRRWVRALRRPKADFRTLLV